MADLRIADYALLGSERVIVWTLDRGRALVERAAANVAEGEQRIVWVARERLTNVPERAAA